MPKHYGRNKTEIQQKLKKASTVLFIAQSSKEIDQGTIDELRYLKLEEKEVIGFIPFGLVLPKALESYISLERYHEGNSSELRTIIINYLSKIQKNQDTSGLLVVLGLILFLFLLAFNSDD